MAKKVLYGDEARKALKRGIDKAATAIRITVGPRGRNVALDKGYGGPTLTNDGVSIAKEISFADKFENMGAEIVKEVATTTNDKAGDGTTTATILLQAMVHDGMRRVAMGANPMALRRGMEAASSDAVAALQAMAKPIKSDAEIRQVATISAESEEIGTIIAETIKKVGKDGVVTVEESQAFGVDSEVVEGMEFDKGYVSPYLITNAERMEAEYANPLILITDKKISAIKDILPLLEKMAATGKKDLVIIADDIDGEALSTFIVNKLRGTFNVLAIKAPGYGDRKKEILEDIAVTCGAKVVSEDVGLKFDTAGLEVLGSANKVISRKDSTVIVGGKGKRAAIDARVGQLKTLRENTDSKFDKEKLEERIAKLSGGVAVIRVGAATETEMKYLKLKIEDAVNATKAAIEEGIVPGGGAALAKVSRQIAAGKKDAGNSEFAAGYAVVVSSLVAPLRQIVANADGEDKAGVIVDAVSRGAYAGDGDKQVRGEALGYDALNNRLVDDMYKAGILDPVKVTRMALQNSASAAAILLTTEVAVAEEPKDEKKGPGAPGMGGMDDMDF
jgi:chaperonin GroEL